MAVKLILVSLVVLSISLAWAQQSRETGGSRRRINLRRFSNRRRAENTNTRNVGRGKAPADILEKRKQLFQRNPSRSRNSRVKPTTTTSTEAYLDVDPQVETISNNDKEVKEFLLDNDKQEDEVETPFRGVSEVRTVSNPSGFRSLNEQIVRVSFKKTTTVQPEEIFPTTQKQRGNPTEKVTVMNRLGSQRREQQPASNSRRATIAPPMERRFSGEGRSDPLKALFETANAPVETIEAAQAVDNNSDITVEAKAAIREMKEDNRIEKPKSRSRGNSPRRLSGSSRNNVRTNQPNRVVERKGSNSNFRSFPARQGGHTRTASQTTRPAPRQRFETRPTVLPAQIDFGTTEFFKEFDFPAPVNKADQFNLATEAPRSAFQLDTNFRVNTENLISNQKQGQQVPTQQIVINSRPHQSIQPNVQDPQRFQASTTTRTQPPPSKAQQIPIPAQPQRLNSPQQVLSQNPFNLLNTNNFQAFDAQFGGSVPTNPGASRLTSSIFTQPLPALLPGRNVPVTPQNVFQATPLQPGQTQTFPQPAATQFANVQPSSFSGHPADNINLRTGAFNLKTG